jgi:hypothetical protein
MALQRISLTDTNKRERLFFQFAPETLVERINPVYKKILPLNGSRETSYYMGTKSEVIPMQLFYTLIGAPGGIAQGFPDLEQLEAIPISNPDDFEDFGSDATRPSIEGPVRFLKSLCYNDPDISRGGLDGIFTPPLVILDWPGILALEGHIEQLQITYEQFDTRDMRGLVVVADFTFVEDFEYDEINDNERIRNGTVRVMGSNRANRKLIPRARPRRDQQQPVTVVFSRDLTG